MNEKDRCWILDLLKIIFTVVVVIGHSRYISKEILFPSGGGYAVEFFFTVSGFMLIRSYEKRNGKDSTDILDAFLYLKRRVVSFAPDYLVSLFIVYMGMTLAGVIRNGMTQTIKYAIKSAFLSLPEVLGIQMFGFTQNIINGPAWYLSAMVICGTLIYLLLCMNYKLTKYFLAPVIGLLLLGYGYNNPIEFLSWEIFPFALIRATSCMTLGCVAYVLCEIFNESELKNRKKEKGLYIFEIFGWVVMIVVSLTCESSEQSFFIFEIICVLLLALSCSKMGIQNKCCGAKWIKRVTDYMFAMYMTHFCAMYITQSINCDKSYYDGILLFLIIALFVASLEFILARRIKQKIHDKK